MVKRSLLIVTLLYVSQLFAEQSRVIPNYKSPQNQYDYLVVTPNKLLSGAELLAQFRQSFSGYKTGVVLLDSLYVQFDSVGCKPYQKIWRGLKYAYESWNIPPKMVVLIGADSIVINISDSTWNNYGDMPSVVYGIGSPLRIPGLNEPLIGYSDDFYSGLKDSMPQNFEFGLGPGGYSVVIGRIPCASTEQCEAYVQKVIEFETTKSRNKSWFNSAMVVSDDTIDGPRPDPLGFTHLNLAEDCANNLFHSWFVTKIVGCAYSPNSDFFKPQEEDSIVKAIGQGNLWSVYIGHGGPNLWSAERVLTEKDVVRFRNDSTPSVFVSFSCRNGDFVKSFDSSMCKQFLFSRHGGALAYIGATGDVFSSNTSELMNAFFSTFNANRQITLGQLLLKSKGMVGGYIGPYAFLGDPALTLSDGLMQLNMTFDNQDRISFACRTTDGASPSGNFDVRIYNRDTVKVGDGHYYCLDSLISKQTGSFADGSFSVALPATSLRIVAYVWNERAEGGMDSSFSTSSSPIIAHLNPCPNHTSVRVENGKLFLQAGSLQGTRIQILVVTLNGKTVNSREITVNTPTISINPWDIGLLPGTYLIVFSTVKGAFIKRFFVAR